MKKIYLLTVTLLITLAPFAQNKLSGRITSFNKYPLKGVKVEAKKSGQTVFTDENGNYDIECKKKDAIKVYANGFMGLKFKYNTSMEYVNSNLIFVNSSSSQFKVVDLGYMTQEDLDYAVKNLLHENNDYSRYQDICDLLQAKFPLVKCIEDSGVNRIYIGSNPQSLSSGSWALLVVDGIITDDISGLSPVQVSDLRLLTKDGAASYGVRGSNGVIEIELK